MGNFGRNAALAAALGLSLAFVTTSASAKKSVSASGVSQKTTESLKLVGEAYDRDDCATVLRLGGPIIDAPKRSNVDDEIAAVLYEMVGFCEWRGDQNDKAYVHFLKGTALDEASDALWRMRLGLEVVLKRDDDAVATIEAMSQGRGAALNSFDMSWIWRLDSDLKESGNNELRRRMLAVLAADSYDPEEMFGPPDGFRLAYAQLLADSGDAQGARATVARLVMPKQLAAASLDPRLRAFLPADPDFRAAAETDLARNKEAMARHPDKLRPIFDAADNLQQLGRPQEALALMQQFSSKIDDPDAFTDRENTLSWWWDELASTYQMLGRYDDVVAAFAKGAAAEERGNLNVSQVLNMGGVQLAFRRGEEALKTVSVFDDPNRKASPYGKMVLAYVRGCAHAVAGHAADGAADLAYAKEHEKDNAGALTALLLCHGDMDGAAGSMIRRLDNPDERADALIELSDYDDPPVALPPHPVESRIPALKDRADVKAAIQRAGGTRRFRLQRGEL